MADTGLTTAEVPILVVRCIYAFVFSVYAIIMQIYKFFVPGEGKSLKDKHVLVTGAGGALGRELAQCFAREGCRVSCADVNLPECQQTATLAGAGAKAYQLDVTDQAAVNALASRLGAVDVLVNNAGIVQAGGLLDVTDKQIQSIIDVNLMAHFWTIRAFLPNMLVRDTGHVVAISSAAALAVASNIAPYTASKAAVSGLMGCLREELRKKKSRVKTTTVQPFFLAPPKDKKHWEVKSVLPDITAASVAASTVQAVKQNAVTLTIPTYLFFIMYLVRLIPAKASDLWRDAFAADIDSLAKVEANGKAHHA